MRARGERERDGFNSKGSEGGERIRRHEKERGTDGERRAKGKGGEWKDQDSVGIKRIQPTMWPD